MALMLIAVLCSMNAVAANNTSVLYTTLGPNGQFSTQGAFGISGSTYGNYVTANQFTSPGAAVLSNVQLALSNYQGNTNAPVTLYLETATSGRFGGEPDTIITELTQVGSIPSSPALVTFTCSANCQLQANTTYWIVAVQTNPNSGQEWWGAYQNMWGYWANNTDGSPTGPWTQFYGNIAGYQVNGLYACANCNP
jgi:hypothetical protein